MTRSAARRGNLLESIDGHKGDVRLLLGVPHKEDVDKLADLVVLADNVLDNIREEGGDILALRNQLFEEKKKKKKHENHKDEK